MVSWRPVRAARSSATTPLRSGGIFTLRSFKFIIMLQFQGLVSSPTIDLSSSTRNQRRNTGNSARPHIAVGNTPSASHSASAITRATLSLEYASLRHHNHCPLGMYVAPALDNLLAWDVVIFVHQGYYQDAAFKFRILFSVDYPERAPTVQFRPDVFHPLVDPRNGMFNLASRFRPWRPKEHQIYHVLHYIKASFKKAALDQIIEGECLNRDAYKLYHQNTASFVTLAAQCAALSQSSTSLFESDQSATSTSGASSAGAAMREGSIRFSELGAETLDGLRAELGLEKWEAKSEWAA